MRLFIAAAQQRSRHALLFAHHVRRYTSRMKLHQLLGLTLACTWAMTAAAQYQWLDKDGRKVFSDRPPPMEIPQSRVLQEPRTLRAAPAPTVPAADSADSPPPTAGTAASARATDAQLENKKAKAEAAETAKKQAEEKAQADRQAATRADNCERARRAKTTLEAGQRLAHINDKGERIFMDETTKAAELRRAEDAIRSNCP